MGDMDNFWNYNGKLTNCYTQAVLTCIIQGSSFENLIIFEIATTVPWGIIYKAGDPNRMIDCYIDPDTGIDRAFDILGIPYDKQYWPKGVWEEEAFRVLDVWLEEGPVIAGPLHMGSLPYLPQSSLFFGVDHYIVVKENVKGGYIVCDPEYTASAFLSTEQFHKACITGNLTEGSGSYTIRKTGNLSGDICLTETNIDRIVYYAIENRLQADSLENGGSHGWKKLISDLPKIYENTSLVRGLYYVLQNRMQKSFLCGIFFRYAGNFITGLEFPVMRDLCKLEEIQIETISRLLRLLLEKMRFDSTQFIKTAERIRLNEKAMTDCMKEIYDYRS